jgi:hypothetical protein
VAVVAAVTAVTALTTFTTLTFAVVTVENALGELRHPLTYRKGDEHTKKWPFDAYATRDTRHHPAVNFASCRASQRRRQLLDDLKNGHHIVDLDRLSAGLEPMNDARDLRLDGEHHLHALDGEQHCSDLDALTDRRDVRLDAPADRGLHLAPH